MSDFFSGGWSIYVAAATIVGLIACLVLLVIARAGARRRPATTPPATSGTRTCAN